METREIKFRAWIKSKRFGQEMFNVIMISMGRDEMLLSGKGGTVSGKDCVLMQFTGLKDKNGTEIYEGDIIQHWAFPEGDLFDVRWDEKTGSWSGYGVFDEWSNSIVIGNIHQNPELL